MELTATQSAARAGASCAETESAGFLAGGEKTLMMILFDLLSLKARFYSKII